MNTSFRRVLLVLTALVGLYVGVWAEFFPAGFYNSFPGFGRHWISMAGAYDEHLIRDVGSFYLALTAVTIAGIIARTATPGRIAGLGWTVFGVLHFAYHVTHLEGSATDKAGTIVGLGISAILGIILLFPPRTPLRPQGKINSRAARQARGRRVSTGRHPAFYLAHESLLLGAWRPTAITDDYPLHVYRDQEEHLTLARRSRKTIYEFNRGSECRNPVTSVTEREFAQLGMDRPGLRQPSRRITVVVRDEATSHARAAAQIFAGAPAATAGAIEIMPACSPAEAHGVALYLIEDGAGPAARLVGRLVVDQEAHKGSWISLGRYSIAAEKITITLVNEGTDANPKHGAVAGPIHVYCAAASQTSLS